MSIWMINGRCEQCANQSLTGRHDPDCDCWCHDPEPDDYDDDLPF